MTAVRWRVALWLGAVGGVFMLVYITRSALLPFSVGVVIAFALMPVVDRIADLIPLRDKIRDATRRGLAVMTIYVLGGVMVWYGFALLVPVLVEQVSSFVSTLPEQLSAARDLGNRWVDVYHERVPLELRTRIEEYGANVGGAIAQAASSSASQAVSLVTGTLSVLFGYLVLPFWMFYAMRDRYAYARSFKQAVPPALRDDVIHAYWMTDHMVGRYIRGQLFLGLLVGIAVGGALAVLGVPLSAGLGVWAGLTELVPMIGPVLGAIPALLWVASTEPQLLLPVVAVYVVVQQIENNFLVPRIQGEATDIPAGAVIVLLVVGGTAFGLIGLIVALPASAILRELFWYIDHRLNGATPAEAFAESRAAQSRNAEASISPSLIATILARLRGGTPDS